MCLNVLLLGLLGEGPQMPGLMWCCFRNLNGPTTRPCLCRLALTCSTHSNPWGTGGSFLWVHFDSLTSVQVHYIWDMATVAPESFGCIAFFWLPLEDYLSSFFCQLGD
jgi:hypothetical protein